MTNTDHTPVHHENDQKEVKAAQKARSQEVDGVNQTNGAETIANPAQASQSAHSQNASEQTAHPLPITDTDGNSTTGKDSVEQDDEDVGGDQDRAPDPKIVPVIDKDDEARGKTIASEIAGDTGRSGAEEYL